MWMAAFYWWPRTFQGETYLIAASICLCLYTTLLLVQHSRHFPKFFIAQAICAIVLPIADAIWVAFSLNRPIGEFFAIDASGVPPR
jgi:hypothetical protein